VKLAATLAATPANGAPAGSTISVQWTGPNRQGDYVTIVKAGAGVNEYLDYKDTARGNPVALMLPPEVGEHEIRYVLNRPRRVLASLPFAVTAIDATIDAPPAGVAGSDVHITWAGPNNSGDWLTVVKPDAGVQSYNDYVDAGGSDRVLELPVEAGDYELRYVQAGKKILVRRPITVTAATAEITAPASVAAGATFEIAWVGPNNRSDWLTIIAPQAAVSAYGSYVDAPNGSPAKLTAPATAGRYELRYVLKGKKTIGTRAIEVTAP